MVTMKLFLQGEGVRDIKLVEIDDEAPVKDVIAAAVRAGLPPKHAEGAHVFGPDGDAPLPPDASLKKHGIRDKDRVHVHRCRRIDVTLHFNEVKEVLHFPSSATIDRVKRHFVQRIRMSPVDATEHVLQLCGSTDRPTPDTQIGALVCGCCHVCLDLVPVKRVEG